jgi:DNA-binding MarR family transcriptional regulator
MANFNNETEITLGVLNAVAESENITQRSVARDLGIALGLTNNYLRKCIKKGFIKAIQAPANRYVYYLTPKGFAEKAKLTTEFLSVSFNFFREARRQCEQTLKICEINNWNKVVLCGSGDLVEIAILCCTNMSVELVGVVDEHMTTREITNLKVYSHIDELDEFDAIIVVDLDHPQETFDQLVHSLNLDRVLTPAFLNISRHQPMLME